MHAFFLIALCAFAASNAAGLSTSSAAPPSAAADDVTDPATRLRLREEVRQMTADAYDAYMTVFPADELEPLTCTGDSSFFGGVGLTLIDSLDTLAILGNATEFRRAVGLVERHVSFDINKTVSVFEANIRLVGGLLSGHILACDAALGIGKGWYTGSLLDLAEDIGRRLLPAFNTATGIPYGSINLRYGVEAGETPITCTAGAGTFIMEFGMLSRLTGVPSYEIAARRATRAVYARRSMSNLVGAHINVVTGEWTHRDSSIGTYVDSFFEYLLKAYLLFGEEEDHMMFLESYAAILRWLKAGPWYVEEDVEGKTLESVALAQDLVHGYVLECGPCVWIMCVVWSCVVMWVCSVRRPVVVIHLLTSFLCFFLRYLEANMDTGKVAWGIFSALQGFWPGMQVLAGDVAMAAETGTLHTACIMRVVLAICAARRQETLVQVCSYRLVTSPLLSSPLLSSLCSKVRRSFHCGSTTGSSLSASTSSKTRYRNTPARQSTRFAPSLPRGEMHTIPYPIQHTISDSEFR